MHKAKWRCTPCVVKKIFDPIITKELREDFDNEVRMFQHLRHPHIVTLMAVCKQPPALALLFEYVGGETFFELLHAERELKISETLPILVQLGMALGYLHASLVVHRDVKPQNVLLSLTSPPIAKLCDFGLARMKSELCTGAMQWAGTAAYMAPELFAKKRYTEAVDTFAFGVCLWETLAMDIPHAYLEAADIAVRVQNEAYAGLPVDTTWPHSLRKLLQSLLAIRADARPSMPEADRILQKYVDQFE